LLAFHSREYLHLLRQASADGWPGLEYLAHGLGSPDCPVFRGLWEIALAACGSTLRGARLLAEGRCRIAFNPLGGFHHAGPDRAEGFCYVNDVALACLDLARRGLRVACLDVDVHHGNGTEEAFLSDPRVLTISVHESGRTLYPWGGREHVLGEGEARGTNINLPLPAGARDRDFARCLDEVVLPVLCGYSPDIIVFEAGMDMLAGDPLAHLCLTNNAVADAAIALRGLEVPVLALGGGGYHVQNTARGWAATLLALADAEPEDDLLGLVGGVFLGSGEMRGGLRDMRAGTAGEEGLAIDAEVERVIAFHRAETLPLYAPGGRLALGGRGRAG
jgi:acetoin utilization protein AcuC